MRRAAYQRHKNIQQKKYNLPPSQPFSAGNNQNGKQDIANQRDKLGNEKQTAALIAFVGHVEKGAADRTQSELAPIFDVGIVAGTGEGKFSPDDPVTVGQMETFTIAEQYDLEKTYNIYSLDELKDIFSSVDLQAEFSRSGLCGSERIQVCDKGNMMQLAEMLTDDNIDAVKNFLKVKLIMESARYFGEDFKNVRLTYQKEAYGIEGERAAEEEAAEMIADALPDYVGQAYAEKYCSQEIISDVTEMIHDIIEVYRSRISKLDWMSEETKQKAISKLDSLRVHVGAPDYSEVTSALDTAVLKSKEEGGSYYQNRMEIQKALQRDDAELSAEPVDKDQWITTPQTVNAFYMSSFNSITFPMAFLQAPVYDKNASYEENLGGVGSIIAHELTHAFDSSGAQYDENGNAVNWWTDKDKAEFAKLCEDVISFFDGRESAPGETEHAVTVEALNFSCCGSFGVRIVGDGSCQIGENDRTIVHISGEKSEPRETEPEETAPAAALFAARPNAALFASVGEEVWDGVLGSKFYRVKDLNMWLSSVGYDWTHQLRTEDRKTIKLGEEVIVESGGSESLKINLDLGTVNANVENISLDIKTKQGFCSAISNADRSMKGS